MSHFAANLIFDGQGFIKNAYISVDEDGTICYLSNEGEALIEKHGLSFYNGIVCPGFINSFCHLKQLKNDIIKIKDKNHKQFIKHIDTGKNETLNIKKLKLFDRLMFENGISVVGYNFNSDIPCDVLEELKVKYLPPNSNIAISGQVSDKDFVVEVSNKFTIGTGAIVSNNTFCVLNEIKTLAIKYKFLKLTNLLKAATFSGAKALKCDDVFGSFEIGKKPGIILIEGVDLKNLKLTNDSVIKRLI
ncbi:MAG: amidohydrolase family protein [Bacteroidales bacterium]|nr:amidohydrolase family protein [Bacteroidales bacterium]